jgi:hypothetical protein
LDEVIRRAKFLYDYHIGRPNFQKDWEDKKKGKMKQNKKGNNPPLFRNNISREGSSK